ncbi:thioesterase domain-containing protein [Granulicella sp. S190]|uniref:thioesterase domain-containing protein n=1 Tax=Granulicella sp. S190 TaxID=1747226 RepID=UPI00131B993E|nr:thioesterase domain-containing protein [Granulicella sp. S190]
MLPGNEEPMRPNGDAGIARLLPEGSSKRARSIVIVMEQLPLTRNGKLDRRALPAPDRTNPTSDETYVRPSNKMEQLLTAVWEKALRIERIGVDDNFFELGGHSLLAMQVFSQINKQLSLKVGIQILFESPTIAKLANTLQAQLLDVEQPAHVDLQTAGTENAPSLIALQSLGEHTPVFLIHPAAGTVGCYSALAEEIRDKRPIYAIQSDRIGNGRPSDVELPELANRYLEMIKAVQKSGPYLLGGWSSGGAVSYEMARQLELQHEQVDRLILLDCYQDYDPQEAAAHGRRCSCSLHNFRSTVLPFA